MESRVSESLAKTFLKSIVKTSYSIKQLEFDASQYKANSGASLALRKVSFHCSI